MFRVKAVPLLEQRVPVWPQDERDALFRESVVRLERIELQGVLERRPVVIPRPQAEFLSGHKARLHGGHSGSWNLFLIISKTHHADQIERAGCDVGMQMNWYGKVKQAKLVP